MKLQGNELRVGVVGTGFVSQLFLKASLRTSDIRVSKVLTGRRVEHVSRNIDADLLTRNVDELLENSDVVFECSGSVVRAASVARAATMSQVPIGTFNVLFHITVGSGFVGNCLISECTGDQPGSLAVLKEQAVGMGFDILAYVNVKGFLDPNPTLQSMEYWSREQGISLPMVTSFTDGSKLKAEQILVANGLGAEIPGSTMRGPKIDELDQAVEFFASYSSKSDCVVSDYVLSQEIPHGVFIVAKHSEDQVDALRYLKCGAGPNYAILKPNLYGHLEAMSSLRALAKGEGVVLNNSANPNYSLGCTAKKDLKRGSKLVQGMGSFDVLGEVVKIRDYPDHLPIGLLENAVLVRDVPKGALISTDDVEIESQETAALWYEIIANKCGARDAKG